MKTVLFRGGPVHGFHYTKVFGPVVLIPEVPEVSCTMSAEIPEQPWMKLHRYVRNGKYMEYDGVEVWK